MKKRRAKGKGSVSPRVWLWTALLLAIAAGVVLWSHRQRHLPAVAPEIVTAQQSNDPGTSSPAPAQAREEPSRSAPEQEPQPPEKPSSVYRTNGITAAHIEHPYVSATETILYNTDGRYSFCYAPDHRLSRWVAYKLTGSDIGKGAGRSNSFRADPALSAYGWECARNDDYKGSGYDKGHLLPSADRSGSAVENRATFLFTNIAPQVPRLNRGVWKTLEEEIRRHTGRYDTLYIVTGGVLADTLPRIGKRNVSVPGLFYKAVAMRRGDEFEIAAYVVPNEASITRDPNHYRVGLDSVERLTGMILFPAIRELYVDNRTDE